MTTPERVVRFLHRYRYWLMSSVLIGAGLLAVMARNIKVDNSLEVWFLEDDPALQSYDEYKAQFGNDELVIVAATDPVSIYSPAALERIRAASDRIAAHPKIRRVNSITRGLHVHGAAGAIEIEPLLPDGPIDDDAALALRDRVAQDPAFRGVIVGDTETMTLIIVEPKTLDDIDAERPALLHDIENIVEDTLETGGGDAHMGGIGVVYEGLNAASIHDSGVFVTLSYLVLLFGLYVLFRRWVWVVIGLFVVTVPIVATLGIAGLAGRDMNMVTAVLPTLIMIVGVLDMIHLIDAYNGKTKLVASLAVVIVPCVINTLTDMTGFLSLSSAHIAAIRDFGWLAAVGLGLLLISVLVFAIPAIGRFGGARQRAGGALTQRVVARLFRIARDRRRTVLGVTAALFVVAGAGIALIDVDTYTIGFLPKEHEVRKDHRAIEEQFGPYIPLELTIRTPEPEGLKDPAVMSAIDRTERHLERDGRVARVTGLPEVVKRVNQIYFDEDPAEYAVPPKRKIIAEELLTYGFSADGRDNLDAMVDENYQTTHITARMGLPTARGIESTINDVTAAAQSELGDSAQIEASGYLPLYVRIIQNITDAQVRSFLICFAVVAMFMMLALRSIKLGLIALIPNLLPAALTLGFMGITGIRLDVATVLIASIAIGIAVNDTCHILFRYRHELTVTPDDPRGAVETMMTHTGRPVVTSSLLLIAGFAVLMFASVKSVSLFGLLSSVTVATALLADLIITPALLLTMIRSR